MNRTRLIFGVSAVVGVLSLSPASMAQMDAPIENLATLNDRPSALSAAPGVLAQMDTSTRNPATLTDDVDDTALTAKAKAALMDDKNTSGATDAIHVETKAGVITLTGDVASQVTAERAQMAVARLAGIRDVVNDLKYPRVASGVDSNPTVAPPASSGD